MSPKDYLFTFNPNNKGLRKILGDLEADVMETVWAKGEVTVRDVYDILKEQRSLAYTTVMTVMSRLAEKGLLKKIKAGAAFLYQASASREDFTQSTVKKVITELLEDFAAPTISQFVETLGDEQPEKIEELARLVEEKRKKRDV
ncbi:MAG: BlaI/MecI/CopY family transcriptional regulator [bacterium]|nr:BlaI/MecI/CopY family transcriptional regulator [bacterium]